MDALKLKIRFINKLKSLHENDYYQNLLYGQYFEAWSQHMNENNLQTLLDHCIEHKYIEAADYVCYCAVNTEMIHFMNDFIQL